MSELTHIHARFIECPGFEENQKDTARQGWLHIKDRATDTVITVMADDRVKALWVLRALNAYEESAA